MRVLWGVLSSSTPLLKHSHAFLVYSGQLLTWKNALTVAKALLVSVVFGSRLREDNLKIGR
jgi:hypothetical protein